MVVGQVKKNFGIGEIMNKREILVDVAKALIQLSIYLIDKRQKRKEEKENEKQC